MNPKQWAALIVTMLLFLTGLILLILWATKVLWAPSDEESHRLQIVSSLLKTSQRQIEVKSVATDCHVVTATDP